MTVPFYRTGVVVFESLQETLRGKINQLHVERPGATERPKECVLQDVWIDPSCGPVAKARP